MKTIKENWKVALIVAAGVMAVILLCIFGVQSAQNRAFSLEEQVNTAASDIKVQENAGLIWFITLQIVSCNTISMKLRLSPQLLRDVAPPEILKMLQMP